MADYDTKSKVIDIQFPEQSGSEPTTEARAEGTPISAEQLEQDTKPVVNGNVITMASPKVTSGGSGLKNADVNFNQYGDDSSAPNQAQAGGMNEKYEGEGVNTSNLEYDPKATVGGLDPNYKFGMAGQWANSDSAGYLARRNDQIASALWNDSKGKVSKEDVIYYLASQEGWNNSSEADRFNTVESIWKRIGQLQAQQGGQPEENTATDSSGVDQIKEDLAQKEGTIYGKDTPDEKSKIKTNVDEMNVEADIARSRANKLDFLRTMDDASIAASIVSGTIPYGDQAWRDLQVYYPEKALRVKQIEKQIRGQMSINDITQGGTGYVSTEADSKNESIQKTKEGMAGEYSDSIEQTAAILSDIDTTLESNQDAQSAEGTMAAITADINKLKTRLKNLRKEANSIFKGDVPDYIVKAYIANRTAEINDKLQELQYNYNAAYDRYQKELDNAWKEKEYGLKVRQLKNQEDQIAWNKYYQQYQMAKDNVITDKDGKTWNLVQGSDGKWYYEEVKEIKQYEGSGMTQRGLKNNNPGNIKDDGFGNVIGHDDKGFAIFLTPEDGFDALVEKVIYNQTNPNSGYYGMNILQYFNRYAGKGEVDENGNPLNDPDGRAEKCANALGVSIYTPISELDPIEFAKFIAKTDSGYNYDTYGNFRKGGKGGSSNSIDLSTIEVPDDIYYQNDGYMEWKVDPNSEEGQRLAQEYRENWAKENGVDLTLGHTRGDELVGSDGIDHAYEIISDDGVTPVAYRQVLYNLVPTKLKDNVAELEKIYNTAKEMYLQGVPADEAALLWYGINPVTDDTTGLLGDIYLLARTAGVSLDDNFYGNLGTATRSGDPDAMVGLLENSVLPEKYFDKEVDYSYIMGQIHALEDVLNSPDGKALIKDVADWKPEDVTGFLGATISDVVNKYVRSKPEYQEVATRIDTIVNSMINKMSEGEMTDAKIKLIENQLPNEKDFLDSLDVKLAIAKETLLKEVNSVRNKYRLPMLDEYELEDLSLRAKAYEELAEMKRGATKTKEVDLS